MTGIGWGWAGCKEGSWKSAVVAMRLKMRGLNDKGKRVLVKSVLKSARADVVCLQETKLGCVGGS